MVGRWFESRQVWRTDNRGRHPRKCQKYLWRIHMGQTVSQAATVHWDEAYFKAVNDIQVYTFYSEFVFDNSVNQSTYNPLGTVLSSYSKFWFYIRLIKIQKHLWHSSADSFLSYRFLFFCFQSRSTSSPGSEKEDADESKAGRNLDRERDH